MKKRIVSLMLFASILCSAAVFSSCSEEDTTETESASGESTPATETSSPNEDDLGDMNFNGETFRMLNAENGSVHYQMDFQEMTADSLNDEIFNRNRSVEGRFNLKIEETINTQDEIRSYLATGETEYNIIGTRCVYAFEYAVQDLLIPISELDAIDLEKAYWDKPLTESLPFGGKNFFAVGMYNLTLYDFIHVLCFNKELAQNNNIGDLYELVNSGKWTFDKYNEAAQKLVIDVNGDNKMNTKDSYGLVSGYKQILPNFWISAGQLSIYKNADDIPEFKMSSDENFYNVFEQIFRMHHDNGLWMNIPTRENVPAECLSTFQENRALFFDSTFFYLHQLRDMDTEFGIIPYPKWNEEQPQYYNRVEQGELTCIPKANSNFEMTGVVLEALSCESAKTVIPQYYERALQGKITRDAESSEMIDLIFNTRVMDWGDTIFCVEIRDGLLRDMFIANDRDLASKVESMQTLVDARIAEAVEALQ